MSENEQNSIKKGLNYVIKPDEVYFYYNDSLIFLNSKSIPFITVKIKNKNFIKEIALYNFFIEKVNNDEFKIRFFYEEYEIYCYIKNNGINVSFEIDNFNNYYEVCFTLYKENKQKVYGLCTYKEKKSEKKFLQFLKEKLKSLKPNEKIVPHKKLAFYVKELYFFENKNIYDYSFIISDNIYISVRQQKILFKLVFSNNINIAINTSNKNNEKIKKYDEVKNFLLLEKIDIEKTINYEKSTKNKICGIIIKANNYNLGELKINRNICNFYKKTLIYTISNSNNTEFFNDDELYNDNGIKKINFDNSEACRKYKNVVRKYLDQNIDGVYIDGEYNNKEITLVHQMINEVVNEYNQTVVFHSTISENNDDFGYFIIKNKTLIENFDKLYNYYLYSGENRIGQENKNINKTFDFLINIIEL